MSRVPSLPELSCASFSSARAGCVALLLVLASASPAAADWFIAPYLGLKFGGTTNLVDLEEGAGNTKLLFGASAGFLGDGILGVEGDFGYYPRFFERSRGIGSGLVARSQVLTLTGNVIVAMPRRLTGLSLRPFLIGGGGLMRASIDDVIGALSFESNLFGIAVGGGATGAISNRSSLRFDLRYFRNVSHGEDTVGFGPTHLSFWRTSVGLSVRY